jgi:hypothetical protein
MGMVWYAVLKIFLQEQTNTTLRTKTIMLPGPCREWSVGLADRLCHCMTAQNVWSSAVYNGPNSVYKMQIRGWELKIYKRAGCTKVEDRLYFNSSSLYNHTTNETLSVELLACIVKSCWDTPSKRWPWTKVSTVFLLSELLPYISTLKRYSLRGRQYLSKTHDIWGTYIWKKSKDSRRQGVVTVVKY